MRTYRILVVTLLGLFAVVACSDAPDSVGNIVSSLPGEDEVGDVATDLQSQLETLTNEIQESEAAQDLQSAWSDLQSEISAFIDSITDNGDFDTEAIQDRLDEFQDQLEAAGDDVSDEVRSAWDSIRTAIERLLG